MRNRRPALTDGIRPSRSSLVLRLRPSPRRFAVSVTLSVEFPLSSPPIFVTWHHSLLFHPTCLIMISADSAE